MFDVMLETMVGSELAEMYWESLMEDSAPMGTLMEDPCGCGKSLDASERKNNIRLTENVLQNARNERAPEAIGGAR